MNLQLAGFMGLGELKLLFQMLQNQVQIKLS